MGSVVQMRQKLEEKHMLYILSVSCMDAEPSCFFTFFVSKIVYMMQPFFVKTTNVFGIVCKEYDFVLYILIYTLFDNVQFDKLI